MYYNSNINPYKQTEGFNNNANIESTIKAKKLILKFIRTQKEISLMWSRI